MPLLPGKANIGKNIKELEDTGRPRKQVLAIALDEARRSGADIAKPESPKHYSGLGLKRPQRAIKKFHIKDYGL